MSSISLLTNIPGPQSQLLGKRRMQAVPRGVSQLTPIFVKRAHGAIIEDVDGNKLLDFAGGIGCVNGGHVDSAVVDAIQKQSAQFLHTCFMVAPYESYVNLAERLNALAPGNSEKRTFFLNSGAEAVENAVKIARAYTGRSGVICFGDAFHGRTYMAMALTSKWKPYKDGFGPFAEDIYRVPYPNPYHHDNSKESSDCVDLTLQAMEQVLRDSEPTTNIAAVIFEPIQGEGGFVVPPSSFFPALREFCDHHDILLIGDEVQSGFGRTGKMLACEHFGLEPDLLVLAKSLASGLPLGSVTGRAEIMDQPMVGALGSTFGGNPLSCQAALATLDLFERENLCAHSLRIGNIFRKRATEWQKRFPCIGDIRGIGGMQAIELVLDRTSKEPATEMTKQITRYTSKHGVILVTAGTYSNVIRLLVPLVISDEDLNEGLDVIESALIEFGAMDNV